MATKKKKNGNAIPEGFHTLTPTLVVSDARRAIAFLQKGLGAEVQSRFDTPDGKVMHAALRVGDSTLFLSDAAAGQARPTAANLYVYVREVDKAFATALAAGGTQLAPVTDMPWGDRWGMLSDPSGTVWQIATRVEELSAAELEKRMKAAPM